MTTREYTIQLKKKYINKPRSFIISTAISLFECVKNVLEKKNN